MDKKAALELARQYAVEVSKKLRPEAIYLYGSYAAGGAREGSDIDVAVVFNGFEGDFLETSRWLWSLTWDVSSHIEPILLDTKKDISGFAQEVMRTGQLLQ